MASEYQFPKSTISCEQASTMHHSYRTFVMIDHADNFLTYQRQLLLSTSFIAHWRSNRRKLWF